MLRLVAAIAAMMLLAGCGNSSEKPSQSTPMLSRPPAAAPSQTARTPSCSPAPAAIVDMINAAFTNGEHLEHAQSVEAPKAVTFVGGNIFGADGTKASSQDAWLVSGGQVYALSSDARRRTLLPDGRDLATDWPTYSDEVGTCVGDVERAENLGQPPR
jgi:hypothetical protein